MYNDDSIGKIVRFYRQNQDPAPVTCADDVKKHPNNILMSYALSQEPMDRYQLAEVLSDPTALGEKLKKHAPKDFHAEVPMLFDGVDHTLSLDHISASIRTRNQQFACGYDDQMLIAKAKPRTFNFPSGKQVDYYALTDEHPVNMSIFTLGCSRLDPDQIFIRDNSITMMLALLEVSKNSPEFEHYQDLARTFDEQIRGIVIAHEQSEIDIFKSGKYPNLRVDLELASERGAQQYLKENGVNLRYYELFHNLRATEHTQQQGMSISQLVLQALSSQPRA